ncbi:MAG TPA: nucleotidyltransferase family protein [Nitrosomonas sp.]|nr:nucleotidyltransferase family protein [Nitrosomonas sp.]
MKLSLSSHHQLLLDALINPSTLTQYTYAQWELLLRLARKVKLLGFLAVELERRKLLDTIPVRVVSQLRSSLIRAKKQQQLAFWELDRINWALKSIPIPIIVLKGVAYQLAKLPTAEGRFFVDLDILVPKDDLDQVEKALLKEGWKHREISAYDEHYYRAWSHEIPALIHQERETEIDIHHTISPITSKIKIDSRLLIDAAIASQSGHKILNPTDMVLHCVVNLFQNNDLVDNLRDLLDLHDQLQYFASHDSAFWNKLIERANQLRLGHSLYYGMQYSRLIFQTAIPENTEQRLIQKPSVVSQLIMRQLVPLALFPLHPDKASKRAKFARFLLYLRSHWIRMPFYLLIPHLLYKTMLRFKPGK